MIDIKVIYWYIQICCAINKADILLLQLFSLRTIVINTVTILNRFFGGKKQNFFNNQAQFKYINKCI